MEPVVGLAIDPGRMSGYALGLLHHGIILNSSNELLHTRGNRDRVVEGAIALSEREGAALVVVMETWTVHGWSQAAVFGLGGSAGRWIDSLEDNGIGEHRVHRVKVNTWRRELFGNQGKRMKSDDWKKLAMERARDWYKLDTVRDNHAEALCILRWMHARYRLGGDFDD